MRSEAVDDPRMPPERFRGEHSDMMPRPVEVRARRLALLVPDQGDSVRAGLRRCSVVALPFVAAVVLAVPALAWTPRSASALIGRRVHAGLVQRLFEITGSRVWQTDVRCVSRDARLTRFSCAVWSQNLARSQDFWSSGVRVRCAGPLTECSWWALSSFPGPWPSG